MIKLIPKIVGEAEVDERQFQNREPVGRKLAKRFFAARHVQHRTGGRS